MVQQPMMVLSVLSEMLKTKRREVILELQEAASRGAATHAQGDHRLSAAGCAHIRACRRVTAEPLASLPSVTYMPTLHLWLYGEACHLR